MTHQQDITIEYRKRFDSAKMKMQQINSLLEKHFQGTIDNPVDYGHIGDISAVNVFLKDIIEFLEDKQ